MIFWIVLMAVVTLGIMVFPLLRNFLGQEEGLDDQEERDQLFSQLADLEYDFYMDKITRQDYEEMRQELIQQLSRLAAKDKVREEQLRRQVRSEVLTRLEKGMKHG